MENLFCSGDSTTAPGANPGAVRLDSVGIDDLNANAAATDGTDDLAQRIDGATAPSDDRPEVFRVDPDLEALTATGVDQTYSDIVGIVDNAFHKVFKRWPQHGHSPLSSEASSVLASASSVLADSSAFSADFFDFDAVFLAGVSSGT